MTTPDFGSDFARLLAELGHYPDQSPPAVERLTASAAAENVARLFCVWINATPEPKILELALGRGRAEIGAALRHAALDAKALSVWYGRLAASFHQASETCSRYAALVDPGGTS